MPIGIISYHSSVTLRKYAYEIAIYRPENVTTFDAFLNPYRLYSERGNCHHIILAHESARHDLACIKLRGSMFQRSSCHYEQHLGAIACRYALALKHVARRVINTSLKAVHTWHTRRESLVFVRCMHV